MLSTTGLTLRSDAVAQWLCSSALHRDTHTFWMNALYMQHYWPQLSELEYPLSLRTTECVLYCVLHVHTAYLMFNTGFWSLEAVVYYLYSFLLCVFFADGRLDQWTVPLTDSLTD